MIKEILKLKDEGLSDSDIGKKLEITRQKVSALVKKSEYEAGSVVSEDEFPAEMYAKESKVIKDASMGGCVIMSAKEYHEYSEANGRYQGRREGQKTSLDAMELRVAITGIQRGDRSSIDVRNHLMNKHGINEDGLRKAIFQLTKEEEVSYSDVCKSLALKVRG